jgi:hypothetical protein
MATTLLPSPQITASKKTISGASITSLSKNSSSVEKLEGIRKFLTLDFKRDESSFIMKRRQRQEEKRKLREENIEKKKESKFSLPSVKTPTPLQNIFSSIGNFLLFLGGGILFNRFADLEKGLLGVEKILPAIQKGIEIISGVVGGVTNFIDSSVKGYDNFMKSFENITGIKQQDVEKFLEDFKLVINGGVIAALIALRALPGILGGRRLTKGLVNKLTKSGVKSGVNITASGGQVKPRVRVPKQLTPGQISRTNNSWAKFLQGTADPGDMLRLARRGYLKPFKKFASPILKKIPIIGFLLDFLMNLFIFKEPLGKSAFMAATAGIGAFIGGALGTFIGGPIGTAVGSLAGGMVGDWAGDALFDVIFGDQYARQGEIKDIQQEPKYSASVDRNTIVIQPIVTG